MPYGGLPTWEYDRWVKTTPTNPVVLAPSATWEGGSSGVVGEPTVLPPSLSPDGVNYWMWYHGGWTSAGIGYATSPDGRAWTKNAGNPVYNVAPVYQFHVFPQGKIGGSYYAIYNRNGAGATADQFRYMTSTDGVTWADGGQALAPVVANWWYNAGAPAGGNSTVYFDGSTYHLFFEALATAGAYQIGYATSSNPQGPYTEVAGNPIAAFQPPAFATPQASGPCLLKVGSTFEMWYHSQPNTVVGKIWSQIYRAAAAAVTGPWVKVGPGPVVGITETGAGLTLQDQTADPCVLEVGGLSYMWYSILDNTNQHEKICLATFAGTLAQLVA